MLTRKQVLQALDRARPAEVARMLPTLAATFDPADPIVVYAAARAATGTLPNRRRARGDRRRVRVEVRR